LPIQQYHVHEEDSSVGYVDALASIPWEFEKFIPDLPSMCKDMQVPPREALLALRNCSAGYPILCLLRSQ
jgi:hypothetical protein